MLPSSRQEFGQYCLRRLGDPVVEVNITDDQLQDRIDEAILYYWQYHYAGTSEQMYKYIVQQTDIDNGFVTLPENIIGVIDIFNPNGTYETNNMFSIRYQIMLNDLYSLANQSLVPYYMTMQQISLYEDILAPIKPIRYNVNSNILYIDMDWGYNLYPGAYLIIRCYQTIDPDTYTAMYSDRWLLKYACALIKQQWGQNLSKYNGVALIGGVKLNGLQLYQDGMQEVAMAEQELHKQYTGQLRMFIG
jgi:hypothetical protein